MPSFKIQKNCLNRLVAIKIFPFRKMHFKRGFEIFFEFEEIRNTLFELQEQKHTITILSVSSRFCDNTYY